MPLTSSSTIALLGVTSYEFIAGGTGSGDVNEAYTISLQQGLDNSGFNLNQTATTIFEDHKAANPEQFIKPEGFDAMFNPYNPPQIKYTQDQLNQIASESDVAILTIGRNSGEGGDRLEEDDFLLTAVEQSMIKMVCEAFHALNKKVIVVLNIGGVIETASWNAQPDAILLAWQGGQEGGNSVADILSGAVNASGKLPMTFPINVNDHASHANFPTSGATMGMTDFFTAGEEKPEEEKIKNSDYTVYDEGIYVGYRHFDKEKLDVAYPFGYGLSYTDFEFSDANVYVENDTIKVSVKITNTGQHVGKEVVQVYIGKPDTQIDRPLNELKAFIKTNSLEPGAEEEYYLKIPVAELSYWDEASSSWALERGNYTVNIGSSSRDIKSTAEIGI